MKKIIMLLSIIFIFNACSKAPLKDKEYSKIVDKGYKKLSENKNILVNKRYEKDIYYKYDVKGKYKKEGIYIIINENTAFNELMIFLAINNKSRKWVYMNRIIITNKDNGENILLNFDIENVEESYWKDGMTMTGGIYEKSIFSIEEENIEKMMKIFESNNIEITLLSDYDERSDKRKLDKEEIIYVRKMNEFYQLKKEEISKKIEAEKEERIKKQQEEKAKEQAKEKENEEKKIKQEIKNENILNDEIKEKNNEIIELE